MVITTATLEHLPYFTKRDHHVSVEMLKRKLEAGEILIAKNDDEIIGDLRYNYFWDSIPFINLLYIAESYRRHGLGKQLVEHWENLMREAGYNTVMTSSLTSEEGQFFYRKLGYRDAGSLLLPNEPLEIIFIKTL